MLWRQDERVPSGGVVAHTGKQRVGGEHELFEMASCLQLLDWAHREHVHAWRLASSSPDCIRCKYTKPDNGSVSSLNLHYSQSTQFKHCFKKHEGPYLLRHSSDTLVWSCIPCRGECLQSSHVYRLVPMLCLAIYAVHNSLKAEAVLSSAELPCLLHTANLPPCSNASITLALSQNNLTAHQENTMSGPSSV